MPNFIQFLGPSTSRLAHLDFNRAKHEDPDKKGNPSKKGDPGNKGDLDTNFFEWLSDPQNISINDCTPVDILPPGDLEALKAMIKHEHLLAMDTVLQNNRDTQWSEISAWQRATMNAYKGYWWTKGSVREILDSLGSLSIPFGCLESRFLEAMMLWP